MRSKWLLRAFCLWTFFTWSVLIKNMITSDEELAFRLVHISLAVISIGLAAAVWPLSKRLERSQRP